MKIFVRGRGEGKTARLIDWVLEGEPVDAKPGWSRLLFTTMGVREAEGIKRELHRQAVDRGYIRPDDPNRQVIYRKLVESVHAIGVGYDLRGFDMRKYEVAVDDAQTLIERALGHAGILVQPSVVTFNGELWQ